jgi:hypothetical protein
VIVRQRFKQGSNPIFGELVCRNRALEEFANGDKTGQNVHGSLEINMV